MPESVISYDTETTGLCPHLDGVKMFAFSTCTPSGITNVHRLDGSRVRQIMGHKALYNLWVKDSRFTKIMHNAKFDLGFTEKELGIPVSLGPFHDTSIQSHICQSHHPTHRLKDLAWELAGIPRDDETAIKSFIRGQNSFNYQIVPEDVMTTYQRLDAERCMLLHLFFHPMILANKQWREIYQMELDLIRVTLRMERRGLMLNRHKCEQVISKLKHDIQDVREEFGEIAKKHTGEPFSPTQTAKVAHLLFDVLKLPVLKRTKVTEQPSTDKDDALLPLRLTNPHPVIDLILKYRSWSHGISILTSYLEHADAGGIIHPDIRTCGATRTGRESCSRPNLQNVEKLGVLKNPFPIPARTVFRPRPGYVNFHIDYAGIELRLLVDSSGDDILLRELKKQDGDPHAMAARVFYPPFTPEERREFSAVDNIIQQGFSSFKKGDAEWSTLRGSAKNCNFAIPYGSGASTASTILAIPPELGRRRYAKYQRKFPRLCNLSSKIQADVRESGYITTKFGRRLYVPRNKPFYGTNYYIQGTAAGVLKRAQVRVAKILEEQTGGEVALLLPIHDEVIIECPRKRLKDAQEVFQNVRAAMEDFPQFKVPMKVEIKIATASWARQTDFELSN